MGKIETITERQLTVLTFVSLLSPLVRAVPYGPALVARQAAWLCPAAALAAGLLVQKAVAGLIKNAPEGKGLADLALLSLGEAGGRVFCAALALWLTFFGGAIARASAERLLSSVFPSGGPGLFIALTLAAAALAASGRTRGLVRTAELLLPLLLFVLLAVSLAAMSSVRAENLLPVSAADAVPVLVGGLPIFDVMGLHVYFHVLRGAVKQGERRRSFPLLPALALLSLLILLLTVGSVGHRLAADLQNAFLVVIRDAKFFGVIERVESVVVAVWILTDLAMLASLLTIVPELWKTVLRTRKRRLYVLPTAVLAGAAAVLIAPDAFALLRWTDLLIPMVNIVLTTAVIPLILAVGKLRKRF